MVKSEVFEWMRIGQKTSPKIDVLVVTRLLFKFFLLFSHFYSFNTINMAVFGLKASPECSEEQKG
jgi:hypothetical protein